jgi:hypothetical protein
MEPLMIASQFPAGPLTVLLLVAAGIGAFFLSRPGRRRKSQQSK